MQSKTICWTRCGLLQAALFAACFAAIWQCALARAASYTITDLGTLGGTRSMGYGINDVGHVVGWSDTADNDQHAFLYDSTMHDLGTFRTNS